VNKEFTEILGQVEKEKGIPREKLLANLQEALISAHKKKFGFSHNVRVTIDPDSGETKVISLREIVENAPRPGLEISLEEAKKINPKYKIGEKVDIEIPLKEFGHIATQVAKQVITQRIREEEREFIYQDLKPRERTVVTGEVRHKDYQNNFLIDFGKIEATLPVKEQVKNEKYRQSDRVKLYVVEVKKTSKGPFVIVSRTHPELIRKLFELEVPEILEGIVEIKGIVREPGVRAKVAIYSNNEKVDPLGACVGMKGVRIQAIARELGLEKIDLVRWSDDIGTYILNALSPAKSKEILLDKEHKRATILLEDEQLKLAIGKQGQNVRLASRLTGWQIDLRKREEIVQNLTSISGVGETMARNLMESGFRRIEDIIRASDEDLLKVKGIGESKAVKLRLAAREALKTAKTKK